MPWVKKSYNGTGQNGKSAYQIWLELGNIGTEQEFIDSLKGDSGTGTLQGVTEEFTINLVDVTKPSSQGYYNNSGNISANFWHMNDLIPIKPNTKYAVYRSIDQAFFDSNGVYITSLSGLSFTTPSNAAYIGLNFFDSPALYPERSMLVEGRIYPKEYIPFKRAILNNGYRLASTSEGKMRGLKMNCLGDSITFGGSYHEFIRHWGQLGLVRNYGINGSRISGATSANEPMNIRYVDMDNDAQIVTLLAGINDMIGNVPLGTFSDTTNQTNFYGACHILFKGLRDKYSPLTTRLAIFTPLRYSTINFATQKQFVNAIKEVAEYYSIPCYDLFANSEVYPQDELHPNDNYHEVMARKMFNFLKTLF